MKPIAVFYHCKLSGEGIPSTDLALRIIQDQMQELQRSGLAHASGGVFAFVNGGFSDELALGMLLPPNGVVTRHGAKSRGETATIRVLHDWAKHHPGHLVCYHHTKGVSHPNDLYRNWRLCMQNAVITNWELCCLDLQRGYDTVGAHWFRFKDQNYWGGNFWWATTEYLAGLPEVRDGHTGGKAYEAEVWIGRSSRRPATRDYAPHFPQKGCINRT